MASTIIVILGLLALASTAVGMRTLEDSFSASRRLLAVDAGTRISSFTVVAYTSGSTPNCYLTSSIIAAGSPVQQFPLSVKVPVGSSLSIYLQPGGAHTLYYNTTVGATAQTTADKAYITFKPSAVGQASTVYYRATYGSSVCSFSVTLTAVGPLCSGAVPCYCQNGYCFNNGATLTNTCAPPSGQVCTQAAINPSSIGVQYAGYKSPVNVCQCSSTGPVG